ncbi:hypothetical protein BX616_000448 [Lobosporangium transversale]|nr:hypothetical protein BX616_000448 [Lobosporangium transversale]
MQNDTFKRFSKDLQEALVVPVNYLNKKTKKPVTIGNGEDQGIIGKKKPSGLPALTIGTPNSLKDYSGSSDRFSSKSRSNSASDCVSLHNFSLSTISKTSYDDNHSFTSSNGSNLGLAGCSQQQFQSQSLGRRSRASSFLRSPLSPGVFGSNHGVGGGGSHGRIFPDLSEEPALVHCPVSVASIDQFSPDRQVWVRDCLNQGNNKRSASTQQLRLSQFNNVLKSGRAWDTMEGHLIHSRDDLITSRLSFAKTGYNNLNEATGLVLVKLMQVSNRASSKIHDIECILRIGSVERMSHPSRSFKDSPGNTATMNEVFLFDVDKPFQLELEVKGTPVATKFGTMAGFSSTQTVHLGRLTLSLPLESMEKSIRTYKLQRVVSTEGSQPTGIKVHYKEKADYEIVIMIGVHVLQEPIEDRRWETDCLYEGDLTVMTRGSRMGKRDPIAVIRLAHILDVQPPDYDKVDVSSNCFSLIIASDGVNMSNASEFDLTDMDYKLYAFTDSAFLYDEWIVRFEGALDQYRENIQRRNEVMSAKRDRRRRSMIGVTYPSMDQICTNANLKQYANINAKKFPVGNSTLKAKVTELERHLTGLKEGLFLEYYQLYGLQEKSRLEKSTVPTMMINAGSFAITTPATDKMAMTTSVMTATAQIPIIRAIRLKDLAPTIAAITPLSSSLQDISVTASSIVSPPIFTPSTS